MLKSIFIYALWAAFFSMPFIIFSTYSGFIMGGPAGFMGLLNTLCYILLWILLSYFLGKKLLNHFIVFVVVYWGILLLIYLLATTVEAFSNNYFILASIFLISPFYGLTSIFPIPEFTFVFIPIFALLCSISYLLGRRNNLKLTKIDFWM